MALFLVATPIGNLADISRRALETLQRCRIIAAEDTRSARRLFTALEISAQGKEIISYGEHNEAQQALVLDETLIFYESPQRVPKVLPEFVEIFGADRPACLAREITKIHETFWRMTLGELARRAEQEPPRGECTLLVAGAQRSRASDDNDSD